MMLRCLGLRFALLVGLLPITLWAFVSTLVREIGGAFKLAYLEARIELESFAALWREARHL